MKTINHNVDKVFRFTTKKILRNERSQRILETKIFSHRLSERNEKVVAHFRHVNPLDKFQHKNYFYTSRSRAITGN